MSKNDNQHETKPSFVFEKKNYFLMLIGLALMALGYILMIGGKSDDPNVFNEAIFNTQRITIAPLLILAGIVVEIVAILYKPKAANDE
jgi:hypothetical protein